ncbi:hypothetical protein PVAND_005820 [Polypedilum vanderplanki]|uniref:VWFC domain-containing protein n=1 Tax=Polypedilum vanderplanki TaxID=319348 RepID=A0A9J6C1B4_POLVA|nr:hypothetical protein PVAND_005820 [Polypedilum vanderplanki]
MKIIKKSIVIICIVLMLLSISDAAEKKKKKSRKSKTVQTPVIRPQRQQPDYSDIENIDTNFDYDQNGNEGSDRVSSQPNENQWQNAPYTCQYNGRWYREREEFKSGPNDCMTCVCIDTEVACDDRECQISTTEYPQFTDFARGPPRFPQSRQEQFGSRAQSQQTQGAQTQRQSLAQKHDRLISLSSLIANDEDDFF